MALNRTYLKAALTTGTLMTMAATVGINPAEAAVFNFSFMNENGAVNGTVTGTVELPDGDGTFAATSVLITSTPSELGMTPVINALTAGFLENSFSVVGGSIDIANTTFFGLINRRTALGLNSSFAGGATFLDALSGVNFGATGVRDADSSTLTFSGSSTSVPEPQSIFGLTTVIAFGAFLKRGSSKKKSKI